MITQDDIDAMRDDEGRLPKDAYLKDPVFNHMQWVVRSAFEQGYISAGTGRGRSEIDPSKGKWFDHWINSEARRFLVNNGLISGSEGWK